MTLKKGGVGDEWRVGHGHRLPAASSVEVPVGLARKRPRFPARNAPAADKKIITKHLRFLNTFGWWNLTVPVTHGSLNGLNSAVIQTRNRRQHHVLQLLSSTPLNLIAQLAAPRIKAGGESEDELHQRQYRGTSRTPIIATKHNTRTTRCERAGGLAPLFPQGQSILDHLSDS